MRKTLCLITLTTLLLTACGSAAKGNATSSDADKNVSAENATEEDEKKLDDNKENIDEELNADYDQFKNDLLTTTDDMPQFSPLREGETIAILKTNKGDIKIRFFSQEVPKTVENFLLLCERGYYNGVTFHRVINDFMIQGGDPLGTGTGGESAWGGKFEDEFSSRLYHFRGAVSMANSGMDTNGSQFFIVQKDDVQKEYFGFVDQVIEQYGSDELLYNSSTNKILRTNYDDAVREKYIEVGGTPDLDYGHAVFGQVYEGMDIVDSIAAVETDEKNDKPLEDIVIESVEITEYSESN